MKLTTKLRAGSLTNNHNQRALRVKTTLKAGSLTTNHNQAR
jgi:hypothetical protein